MTKILKHNRIHNSLCHYSSLLRNEAVSKGKENANYAINHKFTQMHIGLKSMIYRNGDLR